MADWTSTLYLKFENERTRAARDLLAQIPKFEPDRIFDLGCGPGNATELLRAAFPRAKIVGLDISDNMLAVARARVMTAQFVKQDIETWRPEEKVDLIFSNAALQFVPNNHQPCGSSLACTKAGGSQCRCQIIFKNYPML